VRYALGWRSAERRARLALAAALALTACEGRAQTGTPAPAAVASAPAPRSLREIPALTDAEWGALVLALSEQGGFFDTDNLISNEGSYLHAVGPLRGLRGGAYIGVGPDQNFSYVAAARPAVAFVVDIRRDNLLHHLLLRALLALSGNRAEYLARLHGRVLPEDPRDQGDRSIEEILDRIDAERVDPRAVRATREAVDSILRALPLPITEDDRATIERFHREFIEQGAALRFRTFGRAPRPCYPSYRQLLLETDARGRRASFVATEEDFQAVKALSADNLIVPVVGDLAGTHALAAIGSWLRERGVAVGAYYTSNVEDYLWREGVYPRFVENVRALPWMDDGMIVRSYFGASTLIPPPPPPAATGPGALAYCSSQLAQPVAAFLEVMEAHAVRPRSYEQVISSGLLDPR
jgi:hypothetical protein